MTGVCQPDAARWRPGSFRRRLSRGHRSKRGVGLLARHLRGCRTGRSSSPLPRGLASGLRVGPPVSATFGDAALSDLARVRPVHAGRGSGPSGRRSAHRGAPGPPAAGPIDPNRGPGLRAGSGPGSRLTCRPAAGHAGGRQTRGLARARTPNDDTRTLSVAHRARPAGCTPTSCEREPFDDAKVPVQRSEPGAAWGGPRGPAVACAIPRTVSMSERVTWEQCPRCGRSAAVGWGMPWTGRTSAEEVPVEYDCPSGCELDPDELRQGFDGAR